MTGVDEAGAGV
jgi:hypothetical protein